MPTTKLDMYNLAIAHVRGSSPMTAVTDTGTLQDKIRMHYPTAIRLALSEYDFTFAKKVVELAEIGGDPTIPEPYTYALRIPTDYLRETLIPCTVAFEMGADDTGLLMYTSQIEWDFKYIYDISEKPFLFPEFFKMGASYLHAALVAPDVVGVKGQKAQNSVDRLYQTANLWMNKAKAYDGNQRGKRYDTHDGDPRA